MEEILDTQPITGKVYTVTQITIATFLGGPLGGGYMISENYKLFNQSTKATQAIIYSVAALFILFAIGYLIPDDSSFPPSILPVIYAIAIRQVAQAAQGGLIQTHTDGGGATFTWGRAIAVGVMALIITSVPIVIAAFFFM
jgi:hypothetical protein